MSRSKPDTTERSCLSCPEMFQSTGPGNRICQPCKNIRGQRLLPNLKEVSLQGDGSSNDVLKSMRFIDGNNYLGDDV